MPAAVPLDGLVEQRVEDRHDEEGAEGHDDEVGEEDVVTDVGDVVPQPGGADGEPDLQVRHVGLGGDHAGGHGQHLLLQVVPGLDAGEELKPSGGSCAVEVSRERPYLGMFQTRLSKTVGMM